MKKKITLGKEEIECIMYSGDSVKTFLNSLKDKGIKEEEFDKIYITFDHNWGDCFYENDIPNIECKATLIRTINNIRPQLKQLDAKTN